MTSPCSLPGRCGTPGSRRNNFIRRFDQRAPTGPGRFCETFRVFYGAFTITGVSRDSTGAALAGCVVDVFVTSTDRKVNSQISDGSGNFTVTTPDNSERYYLVAYKTGSPDVCGTTVNTLIPIAP